MNLENRNLRKYPLPQKNANRKVSDLNPTVPAGVVSIIIKEGTVEVVKDECVSWWKLDQEIKNMLRNM
jgi:hypothetical protein